MKLRRLQKALCRKYLPLPHPVLPGGLHHQQTSLFTDFRSRKTLPHLSPALPGTRRPLTCRASCCHRFAWSLQNQSSSSERKLNILYIFPIFTSLARCYHCAVSCVRHSFTTERNTVVVCWEQWEHGWNNWFRAGVANGLLSWILNPEGLLPLNEIIAINI